MFNIITIVLVGILVWMFIKDKCNSISTFIIGAQSGPCADHHDRRDCDGDNDCISKFDGLGSFIGCEHKNP